MADAIDNIKAIYELLPSKDKKTKSEKEFSEEFRDKMLAIMKKNNIPFTNKAYSQAIIMVRENAESKGFSAGDSIENVITSTFSAMSLKEIAFLRDEVPGKSDATIKDVADAVVAAKVAEDIIGKDKISEEKAPSQEELDTMAGNYGSLDYSDQTTVIRNYSRLSIEKQKKVVEEILAAIDEANLSDKDKEVQSDDAKKLYEGALAERIIDQMDETQAEKLVQEALRESTDKALIIRIKTMMLDPNTSMLDIAKEIGRIKSELAQNVVIDNEAVRTKEKSRAQRVDYGDLNPDVVQEELHCSLKEALIFIAANNRNPNVYSPEGPFEQQIDKNSLVQNEFNVEEARKYRSELDRVFDSIIEFEKPGFEEQLAIRAESKAAYSRAGDKELFEGGTKNEFGMKQVISSIDIKTDSKAIEAATELFSKKIMAIFASKDETQKARELRLSPLREWEDAQMRDVLEDETIPPEVKKIFQKLFERSFVKSKNSILSSEEKMSEYLEFISPRRLSEVIKGGLNGRALSQEPMERIDNEDDTRKKLLTDNDANQIYATLGEATIGGLRSSNFEKPRLVDMDKSFSAMFGDVSPIVSESDLKEISENPAVEPRADIEEGPQASKNIDGVAAETGEGPEAEPIEYNDISGEAIAPETIPNIEYDKPRNDIGEGKPVEEKPLAEPEYTGENYTQPMESGEDIGFEPNMPDDKVEEPSEPVVNPILGQAARVVSLEEMMQNVPEKGPTETTFEAGEVVPDAGEVAPEVGETLEEVTEPGLEPDRAIHTELVKTTKGTRFAQYREQLSNIVEATKELVTRIKNRITGKTSQGKEDKQNDDDFIQ